MRYFFGGDWEGRKNFLGLLVEGASRYVYV